VRLLAAIVLTGLAWLAVAVDARAADSCTFSTLDVAFGAYDTTSVSPLDGTGQVSVDCQGNSLTVTIALGFGGGGSYANQRMVSGANQMTYGLFTDPGHAFAWGNGSAGTTTVACTTGVTSNGCVGSNPSGGNRRAVRPIYGRVPALQDVGVGSYSDAVQVTVTF
jgi:spore coat protein U-like protein